jgi:hypothetical protein
VVRRVSGVVLARGVSSTEMIVASYRQRGR